MRYEPQLLGIIMTKIGRISRQVKQANLKINHKAKTKTLSMLKAMIHISISNYLKALTAVIQLSSLDGMRPRQTLSATPCK